jgi:hypothetical protein
MAKIVLSQPTFDRFDKAAQIANELENRAGGSKSGTPFKAPKAQRLARLTAETTTPNGGLTWQAEEVYIDEAGAPQAKTNGFLWTDDNPIFTLNPATQNAVLLVSQKGRPADSGATKAKYWFGNPGGGGGGTSLYRLLVNNDFTLALNAQNNTDVSLVDNLNAVISTPVLVMQRKYTTANFYAGEILYAIDDGITSAYLLDPFLAGIGGS